MPGCTSSCDDTVPAPLPPLPPDPADDPDLLHGNPNNPIPVNPDEELSIGEPSDDYCSSHPYDCDYSPNVTEESGEITDVQKIGIAVTMVLMDVIIMGVELSLMGLQLLLILELGTLGVALDVLIFPLELVVADFGFSFSLMALKEIKTGQKQELKWTFIPALFSELPSGIQQSILSNTPDPLHKILKNKEP